MKQMLISLIVLTMVGCAATKPTTNTSMISQDEQWAKRFSKEEKIQLLYERGQKQFQEAKQLTSREHLEKAREEFLFLKEEFNDSLAAKSLEELERYEQNVITYYINAAQEAMTKKQLADAAGYYKLLLRFDSSQTQAAEFLTQHQDEINKKIQEIRTAGETYLKKKQYIKAQKVFERLMLIAYSPEIDSALSQVKVLKAQQDKRRQQSIKRLIQKDAAEPPTEIEYEKVYNDAKRAFEKKDYLKAYSLFSLIGQGYKDSSLYLERTADKIEALELNEETN